MVYVFAVEGGEGFECGGEDLGWERDSWFGRCEGFDATDGGFVERDGETLLDVTFPEEFENLVRVRRKCKGSCGSGTMLLHDSLVVKNFDRIIFLDTVDEDLVNPFQLVLP